MEHLTEEEREALNAQIKAYDDMIEAYKHRNMPEGVSKTQQLLDTEFWCLNDIVTALSVENFYDGPLCGKLRLSGREEELEYSYISFENFLEQNGFKYREGDGTDDYDDFIEKRYFLVLDTDKKTLLGYITEGLTTEFRNIYSRNEEDNQSLYNFIPMTEKETNI